VFFFFFYKNEFIYLQLTRVTLKYIMGISRRSSKKKDLIPKELFTLQKLG